MSPAILYLVTTKSSAIVFSFSSLSAMSAIENEDSRKIQRQVARASRSPLPLTLTSHQNQGPIQISNPTLHTAHHTPPDSKLSNTTLQQSTQQTNPNRATGDTASLTPLSLSCLVSCSVQKSALCTPF